MRVTQSPLWVAILLLSLTSCGGNEEDPQARRLVRELREGSSEQRQAATLALRALGQRGFVALRPLLDDADSKVRTRAAFVWKYYADGAIAHVDLASRLVRDEAWVIRRSAATVLGRAAPSAPRAADVLIERAALEKHPSVLEDLARGLGRAPPSHAPAATGQLVQLGTHGAANVRAAAVEALGRVGRGQAGADAVVASAMTTDPSDLVRIRAAAAWWRLTDESDEAVELLRGGLLSDRDGVPEAALEGLKDLGSAAEPVIPMLVQLLDDQTLRVRAAETLGAMGEAAEPALPRLIRALDDRSSWFRQAAEKAVRSIRGS